MTGIFANVIRVSQPFSFSPGVPRTFTRNRGNEEKSSITLCMAGTMVTAGISLFPTVLLISFHFSFRGKGPGMLQFQIIHVRECFAPHCEQAENEPKQQQNSSCQVSNSKVFKIPLSNSRFSIRSFFGGLLGSHSNRCNVCWHTGTDFCWSSMKNTPHSKSLTTGYSNILVQQAHFPIQFLSKIPYSNIPHGRSLQRIGTLPVGTLPSKFGMHLKIRLFIYWGSQKIMR